MNNWMFAASIVLTVLFLVLILLGCSVNRPEPEWTSYTVRPGETLYGIAEELGIRNFSKWRYEVCQKNNITGGGWIYPGDVILIYK